MTEHMNPEDKVAPMFPTEEQIKESLQRMKTGKIISIPPTSVCWDTRGPFSVREKADTYEYQLSAPTLDDLRALYTAWKTDFQTKIPE